jgi:DNA polymerase
MCLAYKLPGNKTVGFWHRAYEHFGIEESPLPLDLFAYILAGGPVEAHNAFFERVIWTNVMMVQHDWPAVPPLQWRCSAAKASAASLPRGLDDATKVMGLSIRKDSVGSLLMKKMTKPKKPTKADIKAWKEENGNEPIPTMWIESPEELQRLWDYCKQDVRAEEAFSERVPDLSPAELALWHVDQWINIRGARFDLELAKAALEMADKWRGVLNKEVFQITGVESATKRSQLQVWLRENEGLVIESTAGEVLDWYLSNDDLDLSGRARRVLELIKQVNRTSTRKYDSMVNRADADDWRARDLLMFCGAGTGRWTGKGIQVQNFPRGNIKDMDEACNDLLTCWRKVKAGLLSWEDALEFLYAFYGDVLDMLSGITRGAVTSAKGRDLIVADYSAIEARCVLWEAGAEAALDVFRRGEDIYCDMATGIYGYEVKKKTHPAERQFGKQAILGLGYGMGFVTFLLTCRKYDIIFSVAQCKRIMRDHFQKYYDWVRDYLSPKPREGENPRKFVARKAQATRVRGQLTDARQRPDEIIHELALMKYTVDVYRARYPQVKDMWGAQENAACLAVSGWGQTVRNAWNAQTLDEKKEILQGVRYSEWLATSAGLEWRDQFKGPVHVSGMVTWWVEGGFLCCQLPSGRINRYRDPYLKDGKTSWGETRTGLRYWSMVKQKWRSTGTYGGKIVENVTQAVARDIMSDAVLRSKGYKGYTMEGNVIRVNFGEPSVYDVLMSVHDELVAEVDEDKGGLKDFENLMADTEDWASGCPIAAEADRFKRYRK